MDPLVDEQSNESFRLRARLRAYVYPRRHFTCPVLGERARAVGRETVLQASNDELVGMEFNVRVKPGSISRNQSAHMWVSGHVTDLSCLQIKAAGSDDISFMYDLVSDDPHDDLDDYDLVRTFET